MNPRLNDYIFDAMMKAACEELAEQEIAEWEAEEPFEPEFSPEFERRMKKLFHNKSRPLRVKSTKMILRRAAAVVVLLMAVGFTFTMSVEALRVQFFNTIIDFAGDYIGFTFQDKNEQPVGDEMLRPTYIPEGYRESDVQMLRSGIRITYTHDNGESIFLSQFSMREGADIRIDGEHSNPPYYLEVNNTSVQVIESNADGHDNYVIWEANNVFFRLAGTLQPSELILMARSVIE